MRVAVLLDAVLFAGAERALEVLLEGMTAAGDEVASCSRGGRTAGRGPPGAVRSGRRRAGAGPAPLAGSSACRPAGVRASRPDVLHLNLTDQGDGLALVAAVRGLGVPSLPS